MPAREHILKKLHLADSDTAAPPAWLATDAGGNLLLRDAANTSGVTLSALNAQTTNAAALTSGTLPDARLSSRVPFKDANNVWTAAQSITNTLTCSGLTVGIYGLSGTGALTALSVNSTSGTFTGTMTTWSLTSQNLLTATGLPVGTGVNSGSVYINPASSTAGHTLLGVAVAGTEKFRVSDSSLTLTSTGSSASVLLQAPTASPKYLFLKDSTTGRQYWWQYSRAGSDDLMDLQYYNGSTYPLIMRIKNGLVLDVQAQTTITGGGSPLSVTSIDDTWTGVYLGSVANFGNEAGLFSLNGDELIATYDANNGYYYYANGNLNVYTDRTYIARPLELGSSSSNPAVGSTSMMFYRKGSKLVFAMNVSGTTRYATLDFSANGNAITTTGTTAP